MMPFYPVCLFVEFSVAAMQAALWLNVMHFLLVVYMLPNVLSDVDVNSYVCVLKEN